MEKKISIELSSFIPLLILVVTGFVITGFVIEMFNKIKESSEAVIAIWNTIHSIQNSVMNPIATIQNIHTNYEKNKDTVNSHIRSLAGDKYAGTANNLIDTIQTLHKNAKTIIKTAPSSTDHVDGPGGLPPAWTQVSGNTIKPDTPAEKNNTFQTFEKNKSKTAFTRS